ncbi:Protein disulfide-isomerase [Bertholletia excelsa]
MCTQKPISRSILITLTLVLLLSLFIFVRSSEASKVENDDEDLEDIEELIALDEEVELTQDEKGAHSSEAEVLSKAQRIVVELNSENTKKVIDENQFALVLGYAPWCQRSAELMPHFAEAATALKELRSPLLLAKLDAEQYPKVASDIGIKGFPTLLLFVNGSSQDYTGGFTSEKIVIWARKKTGEPVIRIDSEASAKEFLKKHSTFVIGLFEKFEPIICFFGKVLHHICSVFSHYDMIAYILEITWHMKPRRGHNASLFRNTDAATKEKLGHRHNRDATKRYNVFYSHDVANFLFPDIKSANLFLGLVKSEPERYTAFDSTFNVEKILQFLDYNKFPLVTTLTELNSARVYSSPVKLQVYVFAEADDFKKLLEPLQNIARKFKSEVMFLYIDITEENLAKPFLTLFDKEESKGPVIAAFDNKISSKYLLESDPTATKIEEFCSHLLHGTLTPYYKSQPIPDNTGASIYVIVGKTFDDYVLSSPKNILLEVHTPWCINCETTSKQVEKLAKHFKGLDNLVFARIDASANEHPKLQIDDYPALLFYSASDKSNPIKLPTKSSSKDLAALINKILKDQDHITKDEL